MSTEPKYAVENGWLVEVFDHHTCGAGDYGQHEPGCGMIPVARIEDLLREQAEARRLRESAAPVGAYGRALEEISLMRSRFARESQEHARKARKLHRAEQVIASVRELADEWEADHGIFSADSKHTHRVMTAELRAALLSEGHHDAPTTGQAEKCEGSSLCTAPQHVHGCYADLDGSACDDPGDHATGQVDRDVADPIDRSLFGLSVEEVDHLFCRCHVEICPLHNEHSDGSIEESVSDLIDAINDLLAARRSDATVRVEWASGDTSEPGARPIKMPSEAQARKYSGFDIYRRTVTTSAWEVAGDE